MKAVVLRLALMLPALPAFAATGASLSDAAAGEKLARDLRSTQPTESAELSGTLTISKPNAPDKTLPLRLNVIVMPEGHWKSVYEARISNGGEESLTISHAPSSAPKYELHRGDAVDAIVATNLSETFAGSDFTLLDLGLQFLHWSTQVVVMREMRKGRGCDVLESRPVHANVYSRVLSWIDQESGGLLMAEGYDDRGKVLKEFEVKSFKKVAGQWQVREIELRNRQKKTSTRLQFDFDKH